LFLQRTPEDGHNTWPQHVGGYADYNVTKSTYLYVQVLVISHNIVVPT